MHDYATTADGRGASGRSAAVLLRRRRLFDASRRTDDPLASLALSFLP